MSANVSHMTPSTLSSGGAGAATYISQLIASCEASPSPGNVTHPGKCCRQSTPRTWLGLGTPSACIQPLQYDKANTLDINLKKHEDKRLKKRKCPYFSPLGTIKHLSLRVDGTGGASTTTLVDLLAPLNQLALAISIIRKGVLATRVWDRSLVGRRR